MSNENVNQGEPEEYYEEGDEGEYEQYEDEAQAQGDEAEEAYEAPNIEYYDDNNVNFDDQPQDVEYYDNYSGGGGTDQGQSYQDHYYYDDDGNPYYGDYYDDAHTGNRTLSFGDDNYWYDDWDSRLADYDNEGDQDFDELSADIGGDDDTIANKTPGESSGGTTGPSPGKSSKEKSSKEKSSSSKKKEEKKHVKPVELGKRSFRWFQRKILAQQIPNSEENLRRKRLLEKCQMVRRVSKPVVTILGAKSKTRSTDSTGKVAPDSKKGSKQSVVEGDGQDEEGASGEDEGDDTERSKTFRDYTERDWAIKNTVDFLTTQGCTSSSSRSYRSSLRAPREDADFRLNIYEHQLQRRRKAIGNSQGAPEITAALRRHAERAVWRAVIDNTKPRYPLPRFILPRHRYLKKVQAQFIGPGSYEVDVLEKQTKARRLRLPSTWATCTARFPKDKDGGDDGESGSGSGGKGGGTSSGTTLRDPWIEYDKANLRHKYPGTYIPFESTPKNFRRGLLEVGSRVPPNAYNIKSPMEEYIKKQTSTRGPYDCYTPSRKIIPYGYHKSQNDEEKGRLGPGSYEIRTSLVKEMHDSYNVFKGMFGKADRSKMFGFKAAFDNPLWPKEDETMPAVGQYDPDTGVIGQDKEQELAPFKVQAGLKKREVKKPDLVAPDYYFFGTGCTWTVPPKGANLASVFRSKTPQIMSSKLHHVRKERNKSSNKKLDLEGLGQGYLLEEHYVFDKPVKNTYVLEDCKDPGLMPRGGPRVDPFAIPGSGVLGLGACCGGEIIDKPRGRGNCCGCS